LDGTDLQLDLVFKTDLLHIGIITLLTLVKLSIVALTLMTTPITLKPKLVHHHLALVYSDGTDLLKDLVFKMDLSVFGALQLQIHVKLSIVIKLVNI